MTEINLHPVETAFPGHLASALPRALVTAWREYEAAHAAWRSEYVELVAAGHKLTAAAVLDQAETAEAATQGRTIAPTNRAAAEREVAMREHRVATAREEATRATDKLKAAKRDHGAEILRAGVAHVEDAHAAYRSAIEQAKTQIAAAHDEAQNSWGALMAIGEWIKTERGTSWDPPGSLEAVRWPLDDPEIKAAIALRSLRDRGVLQVEDDEAIVEARARAAAAKRPRRIA